MLLLRIRPHLFKLNWLFHWKCKTLLHVVGYGRWLAEMPLLKESNWTDSGGPRKWGTLKSRFIVYIMFGIIVTKSDFSVNRQFVGVNGNVPEGMHHLRGKHRWKRIEILLVHDIDREHCQAVFEVFFFLITNYYTRHWVNETLAGRHGDHDKKNGKGLALKMWSQSGTMAPLKRTVMLHSTAKEM